MGRQTIPNSPAEGFVTLASGKAGYKRTSLGARRNDRQPQGRGESAEYRLDGGAVAFWCRRPAREWSNGLRTPGMAWPSVTAYYG